MTTIELAHSFALEMIRKSGVREWGDAEALSQIAVAARSLAEQITGEAIPPPEPTQCCWPDTCPPWLEELMATKFLVTEMDGTPKQIVLADHAGDFSPTASKDLRKTTDGSQETDVQITLASLANSNGTSTGGRQSVKFDFGENRAEWYSVRMTTEIASTPTAGSIVEIFLAPSQSATAGVGNPGNVSGTDAAYSGYSSNLDASLAQLMRIGTGVVTSQATGTIQVMECGRFSPPERYGSLVVRNGSGAAFHSDDAEMHITLDPVVVEAQ